MLKLTSVSKVVTPVTSSVPGRSTLLVHSASVPAAFVWITCRAEPGLIALTSTVPLGIPGVVPGADEVLTPSCKRNKTCSTLLFKS